MKPKSDLEKFLRKRKSYAHDKRQRLLREIVREAGKRKAAKQ
jgi:hypothetical protein